MMEKVQDENVGLLLRQLKDGSEPAFNALYRLHSTMLLANIRNLVRDQETAKELLQELYLKIWENRANIDETKSFRAYLFTIARNMVYNHFRKVALDNKAKLRLINEVTEVYEHNHAGLDDAANTALLQEAVQGLSPQCREVYRLSRMEGKSHEEIGRLMGISPSTVNNHIVKAKRQMRSFLANNHDLAVILVTAWAINQLR
jgi:RNA polymerase sigma-70 factor (family 1)